MKAVDVEFLKSVFGDQRVHFTLAKVTKAEVTPSRATMRVQCTTLPEELDIIATVTFPSCSQGAGFFLLPQEDDLGVVAYSDLSEPYWIGHLSSPDDLIPQRAVDGNILIQAPSGKQAYLLGKKAFIGDGSVADPDQPLVLGTVLSDFFTDLLGDLKSFVAQIKQFADSIKTGPVAIDSVGGSCVTHPALQALITGFEAQVDSYSAQIDTRKNAYIDTAASNILSQSAFTDRGG